MKEIAQVLDLWSAVSSASEEAVLATVVKTQGSSYRLPGARLLLTKHGKHVGAISGGCLEDDVIKKAWWLTEKGPVIRRYDTTPDNEISTSGYGLGCSGIVYVLMERLQPGHAKILDLIRQVRKTRQAEKVAHILQPDSEAGRHLFSTADFESSDRELFIETLTPAVRLLIFGAGDDAVPLTDMAKYLGWEVFVFDGRSHYARREKFPSADDVIVRITGAPLPAVDPWTVAVLMSHSYSQDLEVLRELADLPLPYLGILGPNKRSTELLSDAGLDRQAISAKLYAPMGLDIGADGPEQVALAVLSEIQASLNQRDGGTLSTRQGSIHARDPQDAAAWNRSIVCA